MLLAASAALAALVLFVVFLPQLVSNRWVYRPLLQRLQNDEFQLGVDGVSLSWLRPLRLSGLTITRNGDDRPLVAVTTIEGDRGLIGYLFSGRQLGRMTIDRPVLDVELFREDGSLNDLLRALRRDPAEEPRRVRPPRPTSVEITARRAQVTVRRDGMAEPLVVVPEFDANLRYESDEDEWLRIEPTRLLDRVTLTPELVQMGLDLVVPMLARAAWLSGEVSADIDEVVIPLGRPIEAEGTAKVTFHNVHAGLQNDRLIAGLERIAVLLRREPTHEIVLVDGTVVDVRMADSVVSHEGLSLGLPRVDPRLQMESRGDVSLADRSLDLMLAIPVPVEFLARRDAVRDVGVPKIGLPIRGTIAEPQLDWRHLRGDTGTVLGAVGGSLAEEAPLTSAVINALGGAAAGDADDAVRAAAQSLRELRERLDRRRAARADAEAEEDALSEDDRTEEAEAPPRRPLLDRFRERRRGG